MMTQAAVYRLFGEIDRTPGIMEPRLGRWRAWPMAKMALVWLLMQPPAAGAPPIRWQKIAARLPRYAADLQVAAVQRRRVRAIPGEGAVGILYLPRSHRLPDGRMHDFIFGDILNGAGLVKPSIPLEQPWRWTDAGTGANGSALDLSPYGSATELLAIVLTASPRLRRAAADLGGYLKNFDLPISASVRDRRVLLALALFEARRRLFRRLVARLRLGALVVTYAPGRFGEIAAAQELGLPIIEFQHGAIGARCPDYAWPAEYGPLRGEIPLPQRIAVFGEAFRELICASGFWSGSEVFPVGAASMDVFRATQPQTSRSDGPLRMVFMTQATSRGAAILFWRQMAKLSRARERALRVTLKLHPEEGPETAAYATLAAENPDMFDVLPAQSNPIEAMLASDVVGSYNSMSLIEALGLGIPAISLCGGTIPGGFAGSFDLPACVMPHVASPEELWNVLDQRAADRSQLSRWRSEALADGRHFFAKGFAANAAALINDVLASNAQPDVQGDKDAFHQQ